MPPVRQQSAVQPAVDPGRLAELFQFCESRNGAVCIFMESPDGRGGYTVQANADGPGRDSFEYLEAEIAGNTLAECVKEVLDELRAQEKVQADGS